MNPGSPLLPRKGAKNRMTTNYNLLSLHKTFDKTTETKGDPIYYVGSPEGVKKLVGTKIDKFLDNLDAGSTIRITNTSTNVPLILELQSKGINVVSAHWHATGLDKGLDAEQIAEGFAALSEDVFSPVMVREDLYRLKAMIAARYAEVDFRRAWQLKQSAIKRSLGLGDKDELPSFLKGQDDAIKQSQKEIEHPLEKEITQFAKGIPECILLQEILNVANGWMTSASVAAYIGEPTRFYSVASVWHYAGYHVVDGKAPKRAAGKAMTWNPKLRTALWSWSDSMLKTMNPKWRPVYDAYRADELACHAQKHPDCKTVEGHCGARARRRVVKEVLKEFYLRATEGGSRLPAENHLDRAVAKV